MEHSRIAHFNDVRLTILISFLIRNDSLVCDWNVWCIRSVGRCWMSMLLANIWMRRECTYLEFFRWTRKVLCLNASMCIAAIAVAKTQSMNIIAISHLAFDAPRYSNELSPKPYTQYSHTYFVRDVRSHGAATQNFHFSLMKKTWLFKHSWHMKTITINFTVASRATATTATTGDGEEDGDASKFSLRKIIIIIIDRVKSLNVVPLISLTEQEK